ncbi:hypothetical protein HO133_008625 [Letharia lupina]|uniref:Uncharacterized protein n=1 Tax=Letharia lupina TaxID=560253 RepID=A0A8H6CPJ8_9LECA|nr:uncharacterized protein HO133_008625 [Letharia lupina]KAF6227183.1 hypothetical protein HO133_008625 [Letharia lupina]
MESVELSANEMPAFGDLINLSAEKLQELETVLSSILALPVARETYAQIIDGKPTRTPYSEDIKAHRSGLLETIIVNDNSKPSDGALQQYEEIRRTFVPQGLKIDLELTQAYQNALPGSREHLLRLLQIAAASVNALAGMIYASFHPDTKIMPPEPREGHFWQFRTTDHFYVDFYHTNYRRFQRYPFGLLNVVGYWAEAELFGGVVLFERVESSSKIINAFLHPQTAARAYQLSEQQLKSFADLGIAGDAAKSAGAETVLPFAKEPDARTELTFAKVGKAPLRIYKNEYDQPPVSYLPEDPGCVKMGDGESGAKFDDLMKFVQEKGWDRAPTYPAPFESQPSLRDAYSARDGASFSSKDGSHSANNEGP